MNTNPESPRKRCLDPDVDLRTIPSGWDLSGFYSSGYWVNEPQATKETLSTLEDEAAEKRNVASENAV